MLAKRALDYGWSRSAGRGSDMDSEGMSRGSFFRHRYELLDASLRAIQTDRYRPGVAKPLWIHAGKPRKVFRFRWIDHLWIDAIALHLRDRAEGLLSDSVMSFRAGRGVRQALQRVQRFLQSACGREVYLLRRDVQNYGPSMQHDQVLAVIERMFPGDVTMRNLVRVFCKFSYMEDGKEISNTTGLPAGTPLQTVFDNLYLHDLDRRLESYRDCLYVRFGDDLLFASFYLQSARAAQEDMRSYGERLGLAYNPEKTQDLVFGCQTAPAGFSHAQVISYLGMQIDMNGVVRLARPKLKRVLDYLRSQIRLAKRAPSYEERYQLAIRIAQNSILGRVGRRPNPLLYYLPLISDDVQLAEIDRWVALSVLGAAHGGGFKQSFFRRHGYRALRQHGLPSLVHLRRKGVLC